MSLVATAPLFVLIASLIDLRRHTAATRLMDCVCTTQTAASRANGQAQSRRENRKGL